MEKNLKEVVQQKFNEIGEFYLEEYQKHIPSHVLGLMGGRAGIILLQSLYFQVTGEDRFKHSLNENLIQVIQHIESDIPKYSTFCNGLAGVGWLLIYLKEKKIITFNDDEFLGTLDVVLVPEVEKMILTKNLDILHGALGLGMYFLKRNDHKTLEKIIIALESSCTHIQDEIMWSKTNKVKKDVYDLGLAHGNASILYFLGKCYHANILRGTCLQLLTGSLRFFLANVQDITQIGSFFASIKLANDYKTVEAQEQSRMAWCYGDPGILHTLFLVAGWLKDESKEKLFIEMLEKVAERRVPVETKVVDACFCHGTSGIGYMYFNLFRITGNPIFNDAAKFWTEETIRMSNNEQAILGYQFLIGGNDWRATYDLLNGAAGIGILHLHYLHDNINQEWNECFFLS